MCLLLCSLTIYYINIFCFTGAKHSSEVTVRNWSNSSQSVDVAYSESLIDFKTRICIKAGIDPPLNLYYLGESKVLEARVKIDSDAALEASLDKIANWKFSPDGIVPEILYHHGSSPTTSPYKLLEGKGRPATAADGRYHYSSSSPSRSGQSTFSEGVKRRDQNMCVFCDATENVTAAHLVAFKEFNSPEASLVPVFAKCRISSIQASENGIALCQNCHAQFDHHFVGVNPDTMKVEVSGALLESKNPAVKGKWSNIAGKEIEARSTMGHWPSAEAFRVKYNVFVERTNSRRAKQEANPVICRECGKGCKSEQGLVQHMRMKGCFSYAAKANSIRNQFSPTKAAAVAAPGGGGKESAADHGVVGKEEKEEGAEAEKVGNAGRKKGRRRRRSSSQAN